MKDQRTGRTTFDEALGPVWVQKSNQLELPFEGRGEAPRARRSGQTRPASSLRTGSGTGLMEAVLDGTNLRAALKRVRKNKGAPGIDGMTTGELPDYLIANWHQIREDLLAGLYRPQAVRRHDIPKASGGTRTLGIPTVLDRFIQQALLQILQTIYDKTFSDHSHGFRPGRSAHGAVRTAQRYIQEGRRWVVDIDLEKFFDRVNHDILMGRLAKRIGDRRILGLVRGYLEAGVMADGVTARRYMGTPQGGPLSPLLANILLDEVDQELEQRKHAFVRYADDLRVFVRSKKAGERVMRSLVKRFEKLHLQVNASKSAVSRVWDRPFLGFAFWAAQGKKVQMRISRASVKTMKARVRQITSRNRGRSLEQVAGELRTYLLGWKGYFHLAATPGVFRSLDEWIRHRLRAMQLKQWKRGTTTFRELRKRGLSSDAAAVVAAGTHRWWHTSAKMLNTAIPNTYFVALGIPRLGPH
ncbi:MAG: group II intron reverse transcriptase/maturase [Rhodothermales bacterium]|nr:group II intron reverse transcriptase/maturase [Rhodothermales bacterium]